MISAHPLLARSPSRNVNPGAWLLLSLATFVAGVGCSDTVDELTGEGDGDFDSIYASAAFQQCSECHAPDAPDVQAEVTCVWRSSTSGTSPPPSSSS